VITTWQILDAVASALCADAEFAAFAAGFANALTVQVGGNPQKSIAATDCPLVALLPGAEPDEVGVGVKTNTLNFSVAWWISCGEHEDVPAGTSSQVRRRDFLAVKQLSQMGDQLRRVIIDVCSRHDLQLDAAVRDMTADDTKAWPITRGDLVCTIELPRCIGAAEPTLD
jgi:hypothetical protein